MRGPGSDLQAKADDAPRFFAARRYWQPKPAQTLPGPPFSAESVPEQVHPCGHSVSAMHRFTHVPSQLPGQTSLVRHSSGASHMRALSPELVFSHVCPSRRPELPHALTMTATTPTTTIRLIMRPR
jgi:hypothetical protein